MDYVKAFLIGGLICALIQILMEKTKMMPGRIMVLLVCTGAVLGAVGIYEPFQKFAGAGASVPLPGFGNVLWKGVKEAVDADGFLGIFKGGFKASAVGISAALVFGYLASLIFQPKMKKCRGKGNKRNFLPFSAQTAILVVFAVRKSVYAVFLIRESTERGSPGEKDSGCDRQQQWHYARRSTEDGNPCAADAFYN